MKVLTKTDVIYTEAKKIRKGISQKKIYKWSFTQQKQKRLLEVKRIVKDLMIKCNVWPEQTNSKKPSLIQSGNFK